MESFKDMLAGNETVFLIVLIAIAAVALLMIVLFIAMLVKYGKVKKAKSAGTSPAFRDGSPDYAALQAERDGLKADKEDLEGKLQAAENQFRYDEENSEKLNARAEESEKEVNRLQQENRQLKAQLAKGSTLENTTGESVSEKKEPVKPKAAVKETPKADAADTKDSETADIYDVLYDKEQENWIVRKRGGLRATRRFRTKDEALKFSKELATSRNAGLSVRKKDGKFQKQ